MKHNQEVSYEKAKKMCLLLDYQLLPEQFEKIDLFLDLLLRSADKQNLIGPSEFSRLWPRHVLESIAFVKHLPSTKIVDIGTGAGFPGFILAICGFDVVMVESRRKRCAFLETVARQCGVSCEVRNCRIEDTLPFSSGAIFTSRAVKKPEEMVEMIKPVAPGEFTLVTRVSQLPEPGKVIQVSDGLPIPPLDRTGYILQYRHLIKNSK